MAYFLYGKRTAPEYWDSICRCMIPRDKQFRALNHAGVRVSRLEDAQEFATKEDAEEFLEKIKTTRGLKEGVVVEIRYKAN